MVGSSSCAAGQTPLQSYLCSQHSPTCRVEERCEQRRIQKKKKITASSDVSLTGLVATATHDAFAPGETCSPLFLLVCGAVDEVAEVFFGVNTAEQLFRGCFRDPHLLWGRKSTLRKIFLPFQQKYKIKLGGIVAFSLPVESLKTPSHAIFFWYL